MHGQGAGAVVDVPEEMAFFFVFEAPDNEKLNSDKKNCGHFSTDACPNKAFPIRCVPLHRCLVSRERLSHNLLLTFNVESQNISMSNTAESWNVIKVSRTGRNMLSKHNHARCGTTRRRRPTRPAIGHPQRLLTTVEQESGTYVVRKTHRYVQWTGPKTCPYPCKCA